MSSTKDTFHPSCNSDLKQALLALRDLARAVPLSTDPVILSAYHQAKLVLRKHGMTIGGVDTKAN